MEMLNIPERIPVPDIPEFLLAQDLGGVLLPKKKLFVSV